MHGKRAAIAEPLARATGLRVEDSARIDTDALGTFSGEIARVGTMGEVAIRKARLGMAASGVDIGLASEGSFGPHPQCPFISADLELLVLVDDERGFTVSESLVTEQTNYASAVVRDIGELDDFLQRARFPDHALISRPHHGDGPIFKALTDRAALRSAIVECAAAATDGRVQVETDMRAHLNPTRMRALGQLAERLASRLAALCPACHTPGFGKVDLTWGLPCSLCGSATEMALAEVHGCAKCDLTEHRPRADGLLHAPPARCPCCNP